MRTLKKYWWVFLVLVFVFVVGGVLVWFTDAREPVPEALAALESDEFVMVETEPWLTFSPTDVEPTTGLIFYPGAKVVPEAYAPHARDIAEAGYMVVVPDMPLNLAVFAPDTANEVIAAYPYIEQWALGGHSLGGAMAGRYVYDNPDAVDGLVFWAAYPPNSNSLADATIPVASIWASLDGLASPEEVAASASLLPAATIWTEIEGGNHAQFGWYGDQEGDNPATISHEDQQAQIVAATVALLEEVNGR